MSRTYLEMLKELEYMVEIPFMIVRIYGRDIGLGQVKFEDGKIKAYGETYNGLDQIQEGMRRYKYVESVVESPYLPSLEDISFLSCPWCNGIRKKFSGAHEIAPPDTVTLVCMKCQKNGYISQKLWNRVKVIVK